MELKNVKRHFEIQKLNRCILFKLLFLNFIHSFLNSIHVYLFEEVYNNNPNDVRYKNKSSNIVNLIEQYCSEDGKCKPHEKVQLSYSIK